ncbi:MAG TPA: hypothetical protein VMF30_10170 [Pirellulales bacterium]|nr:hypothetical protein [Pirellulales bacterium]
MRRHFSFPRLAIVVAWAALSPQCGLLVQSWTGLYPGATVSDAEEVAPDFQGRWDWLSDRLGAVVQKIDQRWRAATDDPSPARRALAVSAADDKTS